MKQILKLFFVEMCILTPAILATFWVDPTILFAACTAGHSTQSCGCDQQFPTCTAPGGVPGHWDLLNVYTCCSDPPSSGKCEAWHKWTFTATLCQSNLPPFIAGSGGGTPARDQGACQKFEPCYEGTTNCPYGNDPTLSPNPSCNQGVIEIIQNNWNGGVQPHIDFWSNSYNYCCDNNCNGSKNCTYTSGTQLSAPLVGCCAAHA